LLNFSEGLRAVTSKYVPPVLTAGVSVELEEAGCTIVAFVLTDVIHSDKTTASAIALTRIPISRPWKIGDEQHCLILYMDNILQKSKVTLVHQMNSYLLCRWSLFCSRGSGLLFICEEV
jgi:hypothetical protein